MRLVIYYLVEISSRSTASFALTCRSLEEPALGSLWKRESFLITLLHVLPQLTWVSDSYGYIVSGCDLPLGQILYIHSLRSQTTLRTGTGCDDFPFGCAIYFLSSEVNANHDALSRLSCKSPGGVLCPNLAWLDWETVMTRASPSFFLPLVLKRVRGTVYPSCVSLFRTGRCGWNRLFSKHLNCKTGT